MKKQKIILASNSPRRQAILRQIGIEYKAVASEFHEKEVLENPTQRDVAQLVVANAKGKALAVAQKVKEGLIVGADSMVWCEGEMLGKPTSLEDAKAMLKKINGKLQYIYTGIAVVYKKEKKLDVLLDCSESKLQMRKSSIDEIERYVATREPLDKAGGYGIQEKGAIFIEHFEGDFFGAVGLPITKLLQMAKKFGVELV